MFSVLPVCLSVKRGVSKWWITWDPLPHQTYSNVFTWEPPPPSSPSPVQACLFAPLPNPSRTCSKSFIWAPRGHVQTCSHGKASRWRSTERHSCLFRTWNYEFRLEMLNSCNRCRSKNCNLWPKLHWSTLLLLVDIFCIDWFHCCKLFLDHSCNVYGYCR